MLFKIWNVESVSIFNYDANNKKISRTKRLINGFDDNPVYADGINFGIWDICRGIVS